MSDQRITPDRRKRPGAGRRADDRILDLRTHTAKHVSVTAAIDYIDRECGGVSRQTFYKWIRTGALETERGVTRKIIIRTDTLRLFLLNRLQRPAFFPTLCGSGSMAGVIRLPSRSLRS